MRQCRHARKGIVTNQDPDQPYDRERPHRGRDCCDRPECIRAAQSWVAAGTNEPGVYFSDAERGIR